MESGSGWYCVTEVDYSLWSGGIKYHLLDSTLYWWPSTRIPTATTISPILFYHHLIITATIIYSHLNIGRKPLESITTTFLSGGVVVIIVVVGVGVRGDMCHLISLEVTTGGSLVIGEVTIAMIRNGGQGTFLRWDVRPVMPDMDKMDRYSKWVGWCDSNGGGGNGGSGGSSK